MPTPPRDIHCAHCALPLNPDTRIQIEEQGTLFEFCCAGCAAVWRVITSNGLSGYYTKREVSVVNHPLNQQSEDDFSRFDHERLQEKYSKILDSGMFETHLLLEALHCPACVWLIEKFLLKQSGIYRAEVNFMTKRLVLVWDIKMHKFSEILTLLHTIGYHALPYDTELQEKQRSQQLNQMIMRLAVAGFSMGNVMMLSISLYTGVFQGFEAQYKFFFECLSALLTLPAVVYSAQPFWKGARTALQTRHPTMDLSIAAAVSITFIYSLSMLLTRAGETYFDSCVMLIFFLLIGRTLETVTQGHVMNISESLLRLTPKFALRLDEHSQEQTVPLEDIKKGDLIRVRPGDIIPVDGLVRSGGSEVDESSINGESQWRYVHAHDTVWGGTMNQNGTLVIETQAIGQKSLLRQIATLVDQVVNQPTQTQKMADGVASWLVWTILLLAFLTWLGWTLSGTAAVSPIIIAISVIIIACPCALGLATPTAIMAAVGKAVQQGWLIKNGRWLEQSGHLWDVVFDKTGTLTDGKLTVTHIHSSGSLPEADWLAAAARLEQQVNHPIAVSLQHFMQSTSRALATAPIENFQSFPGQGLSGILAGRIVCVGKKQWIAEQLTAKSRAVFQNNNSHELEIYVAVNGELEGILYFQDQLRPNIQAMIAKLRHFELELHILSGDQQERVAATAAILGIQQAHGNLLPQQKLAYLKELQSRGRQVVMIGDGINDAPSLTQADLGIALNNAADLSLQAADVIFMNASLENLAGLLHLAERTKRTIRQNFALSLLYNSCTIPMAMAGWIMPIIAAIAMASSSVLVTLNSLRLRRS